MSSKTETMSAIRRLSAGRGDREQREEDARALGKEAAGDRRVTRTLVHGCWDDDQEVRRVCKQTLRRQFQEMDSEGRELLLNVLLVDLAGDSDPPRQAVTLLSSIIDWVRNNRASEPHLFSTIVTEAERSRRGGSYPPRVRRALKDLYRSSPTDDSPTANVVENFNQQRSLNQLLSDTAPPTEVKSSLQLFGDVPLSETDFDVLLYHLVPIRNIRNESVMVQALRNLENWSKELPRDDKFDLTEAVEELNAYQRTDNEQLPGRLRNEIALSKVAVDVLGQEIDRLRDLPQYRQPIEHIIETLDGVTGVRDVIDVLVDVAREEEGPERQKAVQKLCSLLTGLDSDIKEYPAIRYRDRVQDVTNSETEVADSRIREVLQEIGEHGSAEEDTVYVAVEQLIRSQPDDLEERLMSLLADRSADDPVVEATLDAVSDEAILTATRPIVEFIRESPEGDIGGARDAIQSLEALGHDDAREQLEALVEDAPDPVDSMARDALVRSGYYQNVRAQETSSRAYDRAQESERRGEQRNRREKSRREDRKQYQRQEAKLRRQLLTADQILRDGLVEVLKRRIESLDTLVELYQENLRVERLVEEASTHHQKLGQYLRRLDLGTDVEEGIVEEFRGIERDISYLEQLIEDDKQRASALSDRIEEVDQELSSLKGIDDRDQDQQTQIDILDVERESLREIREGYRESSQNRDETLSNLRQRLERERANLEDASVAVSGSFTDIKSSISFAQQREQRIETLTNRRESEWERVLDAVEERESDLDVQLSTLQSTIDDLESTQRSLNETTKAIGDDKLAQQHLSQQSREDQEAFHRIEPRARGEARHQHETAVSQANFHKHHHEYLAFIRRYYESRLSSVESGRFEEEYAASIREIEADVEEYYE